MSEVFVDLWSIVHFTISFFAFIIVFLFLKALFSKRRKPIQKRIQSTRRRQAIGSLKPKRVNLTPILFLSFIVVIVAGILWELLENSDWFLSLSIPSFDVRDSVINVISDLIFDSLGAGLSLILINKLIRKK